MPDSWSKKKRVAMCGNPHQSRPDLDNLLKGLADAVYPEDDSMISSYGSIEKVWAEHGFIEIT
jgi:Holliday junction resolvase RusA-like endonuclease